MGANMFVLVALLVCLLGQAAGQLWEGLSLENYLKSLPLGGLTDEEAYEEIIDRLVIGSMVSKIQITIQSKPNLDLQFCLSG